MTTDYKRKVEEVEDEEPAQPIVVRQAGVTARPPSGPVRIVVERHRFTSWFIRGVAMGCGFSIAIYLLNWALGVIG